MKKIKFIAPVLATVTGLAAGAAAFGCSCNPGSKEIKVTGIEISQSSLTMKVNDEQTIFATITPEDATNKKVKWAITSGSEYISIDKTETTSKETVKVTAKAVGEATITVTSDGDSSFTKTCTVNVQDEIISASIKKIHEVEANATTTAELTIDPTTTGIKSVEWTAEDDSIVKLTPDSTDKSKCSIEGLKNGKTALTAVITDVFDNVKNVSTTVYVHEGLFKDQFEFVEQTKANTVWIKRKTSWTVPADVFVPECDPSNENNIVTGIWGDTFKSKTAMKTVSLPNTVTFIGNDAFNGCTGLTSIKIPEKMTDISGGCYYNCSNLVDVVLPPNLQSIQLRSFYNCKSLKKLTLPKTVNYLAPCFQNCGINTDDFKIEFEDVDSGEDVTMNIRGGCFSGCTTLKTITFPTNKKVEFNKKSGVIDSGSIFENCTSLTDITLSKNSFVNTYISGSDFVGCTNLTNINIPSDHPTYSFVSYDGTENKALVAKKVNGSEKSAVLVWVINSPNDVDLSKLGTLTDYPITEIGQYAFKSFAITSINIPSNITSIGIGAFASCSSLASVTLNEGLTTINKEAFSGCTQLASITIPSTVTSIQTDAFKTCSALLNVTVDSATIATADNPGQLFNKITGKVVKVPEGTTVGSTLASTSNYTKSESPVGGYDIYTATA